ncbi:MAG: LysM peptidoglycan-binding domain-containing protein [Rikenellaceae bacterium]
MKRFILICTFSLCVVAMAFAVTKSQVVVYINGQRYYIHTVEEKETIYGISKAYGVEEQIIIDLNSAELKAGENIKIPFQSTPSPQDEMSARKLKRTFESHKVKAGETLYSISRSYEISVETIMEDNPTIDPIALKTGETILIRKKMQGKSSHQEIETQWADYQADLNLAVEADGYLYHIVEPGETIYSLSKQHQISEEEFIALNSLEDGLKAGAMVKIPTIVEDESQDEEILEESQDEQIKDIAFRSLRSGQTLKVALLLPLSSGESVNRQFADFYQGFEMGLDSVRLKWGRDIELTLFDTQRSSDIVEQIIDSEEFEGTDLIVGPIYEQQIAPVVAWAQRNQVPVVSPLASIQTLRSGTLFQLAPPAENKYKKVEPMLADTKHVTLIYTEKTDSLFEKSILEMMGERPYQTHTYKYVHPTIVAQSTRVTAGDLTPFINNDKDNTIVVMSSNETDVDRVLSALSSAKVNIIARGGKSPKYEVLGNSEWSRYKNIDRSILFNNNVVLLSSYHAKRDSFKVRLFDSNHIQKYGTIPSLYTYRGYDAAMIFGEALYSDIDYKLQGRLFAPLQSIYRFQADPQSGINVNGEWIRVQYNNNYTITIE